MSNQPSPERGDEPDSVYPKRRWRNAKITDAVPDGLPLALNYRALLRYFLLLPGWDKEIAATGHPMRHLGQYMTLASAVHAMRVTGEWVANLCVWNAQTEQLAGVLKQDAPANPRDAMSPAGAIEYFRLDPDGQQLVHEFYRPDTFNALLAAGSLP